MQLYPYLTFSGNCREAMTFYKACLGGELTIQSVGESALSEKMPKQMKDCVLHATLSKNGMVLMASDMVSEKGLIKGNNIAVTLNCQTEEEVKACYAKLSAGGVANHPLQTNFGAALFGDLTDKFGNHWILNYTKKHST